MLWILEIKHQEFNQQKVLEARLNAWLQQKKIKLAPAEREREKNLAQHLNPFFPCLWRIISTSEQ